MAQSDRQQIGDGNDNYGQAAGQMAKAAKQAGQETAKQATAKGAEATVNAAAATVKAGAEGGKAVAEIAAGTASGGPVGAIISAAWSLRHMKNAVSMDNIKLCDISPQTYLEIMTQKYYWLRKDNQLEEVEEILDMEFGEGKFWSYPLAEIDEVIEGNYKVVLVNIVNITKDAEQESLYRWFTVPEDWTKEDFLNKLKNIY